MSDTKTYTEREVRKREREAVVRTVDAMWYRVRDRDDWAGSEALAARLYPNPKITRPREVYCDWYTWRVVNGTLQRTAADGSWVDCVGNNAVGVSKERVEVWADLFVNPTEEVEG